eukprot:6491100-Amphidinium_carterae.1
MSVNKSSWKLHMLLHTGADTLHGSCCGLVAVAQCRLLNNKRTCGVCMNLSEWGDIGISAAQCPASAVAAFTEWAEVGAAEDLHGQADAADDFADWATAGFAQGSVQDIVEDPLPATSAEREPFDVVCLPAKRGRGRPKKASVASVDRPSGGDSALVSAASMTGGLLEQATRSHPYQVDSAMVFQGLAGENSRRLRASSSLQRMSLQGYCLLPKTAGCMVHCAQAAQTAEERDAEYAKLEESYLSSAACHSASVITKSKLMDVSDKTFASKLMRLAGAQLCTNRVVKHLLEEKLASSVSTCELIGYLEFHAYDETPLRTKLQESGMCLTSRVVPSAGHVSSTLDITKRLAATIKSSAVICKILQDQQWCGILLKKGETYVKLLLEQPVPLQVLHKTTSDSMARALQLQSNSGKGSAAFAFCSLVTASDKAGYNLKGEKEFLKAREHSWSHLPLHCEVHDNSRIFGATVEGLVPEQTTGLINTALSLRHSGTLAAFRLALKCEVEGSLVILHGCCSCEASQHKKRVLEAFAEGTTKSLSQLVLISVLPNGDWRDDTSVQHYVDHDVTREDHPSIAENITAGLMYALVARKPPVWCRHRWNGCQAALSELGLLAAIHNLLARSYKRMVNNLKSGHSLCKSLSGDIGVSDFVVAGGVSSRLSNQDGGLHGEASGMGSSMQSAELVELSEECETSEANTVNWAAENEAQRRKAIEWLQTQPFPSLCMLALCIAPLQALMHRQFETSGKAWDHKQNVSGVKKIEAGNADGHLCREYQLTIAAKQVLETEFQDSVKEVMTSEDKWQVIDFEKRDVHMNNLAFRMLSRQGAMVEACLGHPHRLFPVRLFTLLEDPSNAEELSRCKPCQLDQFSADLLNLCPGFSGTDCLELLHLHAAMAWTSTARVESVHSSVRRNLVLRSVQTHCLPLTLLSAEFFLQQMRTNKQAVKRLCGVDSFHRQAKPRSKVNPKTNAPNTHSIL